MQLPMTDSLLPLAATSLNVCSGRQVGLGYKGQVKSGRATANELRQLGTDMLAQ